jgi:uncharacterized protein
MQRDILAYKCRKCGHLHYPYRMRCKKCGHVEFEGADVVFDTVPMPKEGKLLTFSKVYALPPDFEAVSLTLGIIELSNGMRVLGQVRCDEPVIGMPMKCEVEVVRRDEYHQYHGMVFYPAC